MTRRRVGVAAVATALIAALLTAMTIWSKDAGCRYTRALEGDENVKWLGLPINGLPRDDVEEIRRSYSVRYSDAPSRSVTDWSETARVADVNSCSKVLLIRRPRPDRTQ